MNPKPDCIKEIEAFYGINLREVRNSLMVLTNRNSYAMENGVLTNLNLAGNNIENIHCLSKLANIESLNLNNNQIRDISVLSYIRSLRRLDINNNRIQDLTPLAELGRLRFLMLSNNQIQELTFLSSLVNLQTLRLDNNQVRDLVPLEGLINLQTLWLDNNQIGDLVPLEGLINLQTLWLDNNQIFYISKKIIENIARNANANNLTILSLQNNPIKNLPNEIINERDARKILAYMNEEDGKPLCEAKVLVLGEPNAGKTTLIENFLDKNYRTRPTPTTHGLEIRPYIFRLGRKKSDLHYKANMWDFGGQEIYHATHRFFLSARSVYILLSDNRQEDTDFRYWFDKIKVFGGDSPLLIVQNEKENRPKILPAEVISDSPNLKQVLQVNFADGRGLENLREAVQRAFCGLSHVHNPFPKRWGKVREALEKCAENYISYQKYLEICASCGIEAEETTVHETLCQLLHDLGVLLHFPKSLLLRDYVIINPHWATKAVYQLIDFIGKGKFTPEEAESVWANPENKGVFARMTLQLLEMMHAFEICYAHEGVYILPQRLTETAPAYDWDDTAQIQLVYRYGFMPKGVLWRLMVRKHELLKDDNLVWKRGGIFHYGDARAEVTEKNDVYDREIRIRISGKDRRDLLALLLHEMERIHESYNFAALEEEKRPRIEVPCNCEKCKTLPKPHFYKYEELKERLANNVFTVECYKSYKQVNVPALIQDVQNTLANKNALPEALRRQVRELLEKNRIREAFEVLDACEWRDDLLPMYYKLKSEFISPVNGANELRVSERLWVLLGM